VRRIGSLILVALPAALAFLTAGCGESGTPESRVRDVIARAETAAEERDLSQLMDLVADSYSDRRGRDKDAVSDAMRGFFLLNQSVHLLVRVEDVQFPANDVAEARVSVGMLGRQSQEDWDFAADVHEFDVRLREVAGEWQLQSADLQRPVR
jgi:hypothetical protein